MRPFCFQNQWKSELDPKIFYPNTSFKHFIPEMNIFGVLNHLFRMKIAKKGIVIFGQNLEIPVSVLHCCGSYCVWVRVCVQPFPWRLLVRNLSARVRCCQFSRWSRVSCCYTTVFYKGEVCVFSTDENLPASTKKNLCILSDIFPVYKFPYVNSRQLNCILPNSKISWKQSGQKYVNLLWNKKKKVNPKKFVKLTEAKILLVNLKWTNFGDYVHQGW